MAAGYLMLSPEGGLHRYLSEIRNFPMLEPGEEYMLAKRWREHEDSGAAHRLVTSHLRLVAKIAMGYRGYGLPINEIVSEGNVGLMQAVKRFEPDKGFRLATYAMWWIRASIQEYILRSWSLVKIGTTAAQKKLFFNLRKAKGQIKAIEEGDLKPENVKQIATKLGVTEEEVISMNRRLAAPDHSLNAPMRADSEGEWQDWLVDDSPSQETILAEREQKDDRSELLAEGMKALNERERHILTERRLKDEPATLEDLSKEYDISRERVRQIEVRAFEKLQRAIKEAAKQQRIGGARRRRKRRAGVAGALSRERIADEDGVVAFGAGREDRDGGADQFFDAADVFDRGGGQVGPAAGALGGFRSSRPSFRRSACSALARRRRPARWSMRLPSRS